MVKNVVSVTDMADFKLKMFLIYVRNPGDKLQLAPSIFDHIQKHHQPVQPSREKGVNGYG